jgi:cardiolipin synthase C
MSTRHLILATVVSCLAGCVNLPPGASFPKTLSTALADPGRSTAIGLRVAGEASKHAGQSGFRILPAGIDGFLARMRLIDAAQATIDVQYYIFHADETGQLLANAVLRAADRGVRVRVLVDDAETVAGDERLTALAAHDRIEVRIFNPFVYRGHFKAIRALEFMVEKSRLDYRMHNKLIVIDNAVALLGGRNLGDEYFQIDPQLQLADDDVFAAGPVVAALSQTFDEFWNCELAIPVAALSDRPPSVADLAVFRNALDEHRLEATASGAQYAQGMANGETWAQMLDGPNLVWAPARLVYDSPGKRNVEAGAMIGRLMHLPVAEAASAVTSELVMITPYFIPGDDGLALLRSLRARNVVVRVLTNSLESTIELPAQAGYMRFRIPLLKDGVQLYEVRALPGNSRGSGESSAMTRYGNYSLHAKIFVFDRKSVFIGSMNFDQRSMHLNTEIGLIIESPELARQAVTRFDAMTRASNAFQPMLVGPDLPGSGSLVWRTEVDGKQVDLAIEPARDEMQRIKIDVLLLLPIDSEL